MADYRNLIIDVDGLEAGKFYKLYTDSNATTLLIPKDKDDALELDVEQLKIDVDTLEKQKDNQIITISNSGGVTPSTIKKVKVRNNINIPLAELSTKVIFIDYCMFKGNDIEAGRLTIIDGTQLLLEEDRTRVVDLLPVSFTANRYNDMLNLNISINNNEIYTFEYKLTIF